MSSPKQIEANRRNALKSTGPITPEGKERSRRNALRHGLTAETVIAALEDADDYQAFEAAVTADYDAETAIERELVLRLASVRWRLRRATGVEMALFEAVIAENGKVQRGSLVPTLVPGPTDDPPAQAQLHLATTQGYNAAAQSEFGSDTNKTPDMTNNIGDCFLRLAALPTFPLDRLSRYEYLLWRQTRQLVSTLESLKRRKPQPKHSRFPFSFNRLVSE